MKKIGILLQLAICFFFSSCKKDGDLLGEEDGYYIGTYYAQGTVNGSAYYVDNHLSTYGGSVYLETNPFVNTPPLEGDPTNLHLYVNFTDIASMNFSNINPITWRGKQYFTEPTIENSISVTGLSLNNSASWLEIDHIIFSNDTFTFPRMIGKMHLVYEIGNQIKEVHIDYFELPFSTQELF